MGKPRQPLLERGARMALARSLASRLWRFVDNGLDELAVIDAFVLRLELGLERYGALDLTAAARDWSAEADEEAVDREVYRCFQRVSQRTTADELSIPQAGLIPIDDSVEGVDREWHDEVKLFDDQLTREAPPTLLAELAKRRDEEPSE